VFSVGWLCELFSTEFAGWNFNSASYGRIINEHSCAEWSDIHIKPGMGLPQKNFFNVLVSKCVWHNILVSFSQMSKQFDVDGLKDCDQLVLDRLKQSSSM